MEDQVTTILSPMVQYGFAGFCFLLIVIIFWMIRKLIDVISMNSTVISTNTATIENLLQHSHDELTLLREIHSRLISRPCLKD